MVPEIISDPDYNYGQPTLSEGYTVLQVVRLVHYNEYEEGEVADRLEISMDSVEVALDYYEANPEEIEGLLEEEMEVVESQEGQGDNDYSHSM